MYVLLEVVEFLIGFDVVQILPLYYLLVYFYFDIPIPKLMRC